MGSGASTQNGHVSHTPDKSNSEMQTEVKEKTKTYDDAMEYLRQKFEEFDRDKSTTLDYGEFVTFANKLQLDLKPAEMYSFQKEMDLNGDGHISTEEFLSKGPEILQRIYAKLDVSDEHDWCEMTEEGTGEKFYYNKRTAETAWDKPYKEKTDGENATVEGAGQLDKIPSQEHTEQGQQSTEELQYNQQHYHYDQQQQYTEEEQQQPYTEEEQQQYNQQHYQYDQQQQYTEEEQQQYEQQQLYEQQQQYDAPTDGH